MNAICIDTYSLVLCYVVKMQFLQIIRLGSVSVFTTKLCALRDLHFTMD